MTQVLKKGDEVMHPLRAGEVLTFIETIPNMYNTPDYLFHKEDGKEYRHRFPAGQDYEMASDQKIKQTQGVKRRKDSTLAKYILCVLRDDVKRLEAAGNALFVQQSKNYLRDAKKLLNEKLFDAADQPIAPR